MCEWSILYSFSRCTCHKVYVSCTVVEISPFEMSERGRATSGRFVTKAPIPPRIPIQVVPPAYRGHLVAATIPLPAMASKDLVISLDMRPWSRERAAAYYCLPRSAVSSPKSLQLLFLFWDLSFTGQGRKQKNTAQSHRKIGQRSPTHPDDFFFKLVLRAHH